jgi:HlyD family secretion protein
VNASTSIAPVPPEGSGQELVVLPPPGAVEIANLDDSPRSAIMIGGAIAILFFVVLLGWAAIARLDAAAFGMGQVTVAGNRQTVQHRDGGNVVELKVREGQHVKAGQLLIRLSGSEVAATERALAGAVFDLQAQRARLEAEISGGPIVWPASFATATGDDKALVERAIRMQIAQRQARQGLMAASRSVLSRQAAEATTQTGGFSAQAQASAAQRKSLEEQLESTRKLADEGYVSRNSVRSIERAIAELDGANADYAARAAAAREQASATRQQMTQTDRKNVDDSAALLRDTQFQLNEALPKWIAAREQLERTLIRAPVSGRVVGLRVFSVGGVIQPGQPILDIVPDAAPLVIKVQFAPDDIDGVYEGREAEVRFLSMHERDLPILMGTVRTVSADALHDEATGRAYFTAEVVVPSKQLAMLKQVRGADVGIRPGIPVQVTVRLRKRTALQYMLDPLTETFARSLRER